MQKRIWKKEVHIAIIREAENAPTIAEVLRKYNIAQSIYYKWRRQFEAYGESAFDNKYYRTDPEVRRLESENQRLKKLLVEKELEIELLEECVKKMTIIL
ncbi:MAG: transposase [Caldisericum sp.]|uniref:transposase n=2 Tax=Caldisericum sp. TaxID=2499687 RepID=UPI003D0ED9BE